MAKEEPAHPLSEAIITPPGAKTPAKVSDRFFLCSGGVEAITSYGWQP